jgi:hypothetical protein
MNNIILALFIHTPGTEVTIITPQNYAGCKGVIVEYHETKTSWLYDVQLKECAPVKLKYLEETSFSVNK